jgi:hypothetical protein
MLILSLFCYDGASKGLGRSRIARRYLKLVSGSDGPTIKVVKGIVSREGGVDGFIREIILVHHVFYSKVVLIFEIC